MDRLNYRLSIHESADLAAATSFWASELGVEPAVFRKPTLKRHNPTTRRRNTTDSYHGCLVVKVAKAGILYRKLAGWFDGITQAMESMPESSIMFVQDELSAQ